MGMGGGRTYTSYRIFNNLVRSTQPECEGYGARPGGCELCCSATPLSACTVGWINATVSYSFAKTPLQAAHAPLVMASISQADLVCGRDMVAAVLGAAGKVVDVD